MYVQTKAGEGVLFYERSVVLGRTKLFKKVAGII
jgi:hypothetical protein